MEGTLNGIKLKLEDGKIYRWRDHWRGFPTKTPRWVYLKGASHKSAQNTYIQVKINSKLYYYHRVVYFLANPEWDIHDGGFHNQIDHANSRKQDNRIENLRVVNGTQNQQNNLHYAKGFTWNKSCNKYSAQIGVNGKLKYLGYFDKPEEAREAYLAAKKLYHFS